MQLESSGRRPWCGRTQHEACCLKACDAKRSRGDKGKTRGNGCSEYKDVCHNQGEERYKLKEKKGSVIEIRARFIIEGEGATRLFVN